MSIHKSQSITRELDKQWKNYWNSKNPEIFIALCQNCFAEISHEGKKMAQKKKFAQALITHSEGLLRGFISAPSDPGEFLSRAAVVFELIQHLLLHKEFKFSLSSTYLQNLFTAAMEIAGSAKEMQEVKIVILVLMTIYFAMEQEGGGEYAGISFLNINCLLEQTMKEPLRDLAVSPVRVGEITRACIENSEEHTDLLVCVLENYFVSSAKWQNVFNPKIFNSLFGEILKITKLDLNFLQFNTEVSALLAAKKFILLLKILKSLSRQKEICIQFIKEFSEKFKDVFISCLLIYSKLPIDFKGTFMSDHNELANLFLVTFAAFTGNPESSKNFVMIYELPIVTFITIFTSVIFI